MSPDSPETKPSDPPQRQHRNSESTDPSVNGWQGEYLDALDQRWAAGPESVEPPRQQFFAGFDLGYRWTAGEPPAEPALPGPPPIASAAHKQSNVDSLIYHYRDIGHLAA